MSQTRQSTSRQTYRWAQALLTSLFFMWGFLTCLNDILIPHLKAVFTLNYTQAMLVQFCFFAAYFLVSMPGGYLVEKIGYQWGIVIGLCTAATGCLMFYPAAEYKAYPLFLAAFFVLASGITLLQVAANPYVTLLGKPESASSRLTLTQAFNSLGTTVAPYLGATLILSAALKSADELKLLSPDQLDVYQTTQAQAVQHPYLAIAGVLLLLAVIFSLMTLPNVITTSTSALSSSDTRTSRSAWDYRHLRLGAVAIFVYVGAEVAIGSFLVSYLSQPDIAGFSAEQAGKYVTFYWGSAMTGRFIGAYLMQKIGAARLLAIHAGLAASLVFISLSSQGAWAMWSLLAVGLCNSIMFPTLFSLALKDLGEHTGQGSGILCAAIVGGAIIPLLQGQLADHLGIQIAFLLPVCCYLYIAYYGWKGHVIIHH